MLLEPPNDAIRGGQPEGAAAGDHDRVHLLSVGERPQNVRLAGARATAVHADAAPRLGRREDHGAAGAALRIRPVADGVAVREGRRLAHLASALRVAGRRDLRGRRRNRTWQFGQK